MTQLDEVVASIDYVTLVVSAPTNVQQTVNVVAAPVNAVTQQAGTAQLKIGTPGAQGPPGPQGIPGAAGGNFFVQDAAPSSPPAQYAWIQTNFPTTGNWTMWVNF